jgi:hypothetical protein
MLCARRWVAQAIRGEAREMVVSGKGTGVPSCARVDAGCSEVRGSDKVRKTVVREEGVDAMRTEVGRSGEVSGGRRW